MSKQIMIETVQRMFREIDMETTCGGFDEMDQSQTALTLSTEFLQCVNTSGLNMLMKLVEETSHSGINRKTPMTERQIVQGCRNYSESIRSNY